MAIVAVRSTRLLAPAASSYACAVADDLRPSHPLSQKPLVMLAPVRRKPTDNITPSLARRDKTKTSTKDKQRAAIRVSQTDAVRMVSTNLDRTPREDGRYAAIVPPPGDAPGATRRAMKTLSISIPVNGIVSGSEVDSVRASK